MRTLQTESGFVRVWGIIPAYYVNEISTAAAEFGVTVVQYGTRITYAADTGANLDAFEVWLVNDARIADAERQALWQHTYGS